MSGGTWIRLLRAPVPDGASADTFTRVFSGNACEFLLVQALRFTHGCQEFLSLLRGMTIRLQLLDQLLLARNVFGTFEDVSLRLIDMGLSVSHWHTGARARRERTA